MTTNSGSLALAFINTTGCYILYQDFIIEESWRCWQWAHKDFEHNGISGDCQTLFECIEAVDGWYENKAAD